MNKNFAEVDFINIIGTSFHSGVIHNTAEEISNVLGTYCTGDEDKVWREWMRVTNDGTVFTVYDWKEGYVSETKPLYYHIGTRTTKETEKIVNILNEAGLNASVNKLF